MKSPIAPPGSDAITFFRQVLDTLNASIAVLDARGIIVWTNSAWARFAATNAHPAPGHDIGVNYLAVCDAATGEGEDDAAAAATGIREVLGGERCRFYMDYPCHRPDTMRWFQLRVERLMHADRVWLVICHEDVTERKRAEIAYRHAAHHDQLTGLANRALLVTCLSETVSQHEPFALMFIDFDRFKLINDTLGHEVGDALLRSIANRLQREVPSTEGLAARLGGDEFVLLMRESLTRAGAMNVAQRVQAALGHTHTIDNYEINPTISIGIVISRDGEYDRPSDVLRDADLAMYEAKADGGGQALIYDHTLGERGLQRMQESRRIRRR